MIQTIITDKAELEGIINELDGVIETATEIAGFEGGETDSATAIRRARDILTALAESL